LKASITQTQLENESAIEPRAFTKHHPAQRIHVKTCLSRSIHWNWNSRKQ